MGRPPQELVQVPDGMRHHAASACVGSGFGAWGDGQRVADEALNPTRNG
jgi:hypothetical protein